MSRRRAVIVIEYDPGYIVPDAQKWEQLGWGYYRDTKMRKVTVLEDKAVGEKSAYPDP